MKRLLWMLPVAALMLTVACSESPEPTEDPEPGTETQEPEVKTYQLGDFYKEGLAKGIVIAVDEAGTSGVIMSLDETELIWSTEYEIITGAMEVTMDDGHTNCEAIKANIPDWAQTYPAIAWCSKKNPGSLTSWYLPAGHELERLWMATSENKELFNEALVANGGMELSYGASDHYWSSTDAGPAIAYAYSFETGEIDYYACDKSLKHHVRCIRKFKAAK